MIERMLRNVLNKHGIHRNVITMVNMVVVDPGDPAFGNPLKGIGKIYSEEEARKLEEEKRWIFKPSGKSTGGFRRVVPSPRPTDVVNKEVIASWPVRETSSSLPAAGAFPFTTTR